MGNCNIIYIFLRMVYFDQTHEFWERQKQIVLNIPVVFDTDQLWTTRIVQRMIHHWSCRGKIFHPRKKKKNIYIYIYIYIYKYLIILKVLFEYKYNFKCTGN